MVCHRSKYSKIILLAFLLSACGYEKNKNSSADQKGESVLQENIKFADVQQGVFFPRCQRCHQNEGEFTFEDYNTVSSMVAEIEDRVFVAKNMPRGRPLESAELNLLKSWIKAGAPQ